MRIEVRLLRTWIAHHNATPTAEHQIVMLSGSMLEQQLAGLRHGALEIGQLVLERLGLEQRLRETQFAAMQLGVDVADDHRLGHRPLARAMADRLEASAEHDADRREPSPLELVARADIAGLVDHHVDLLVAERRALQQLRHVGNLMRVQHAERQALKMTTS